MSKQNFKPTVKYALKTKELRKYSDLELLQLKKKLQAEEMLETAHITGNVMTAKATPNPGKRRQIKKNIARVNTIISERTRGSMK